MMGMFYLALGLACFAALAGLTQILARTEPRD